MTERTDPASDAPNDARAPEEGTTDTGSQQGRLPVRAAPITQAQLERVIRRASDLQFRGSGDVGQELAPDEVIRIGQEVGIDTRYMQQALAEVRAETLLPALPDDEGFGARAFGVGLLRASRAIPGDVAEVEGRLDEFLAERELLRKVRSRAGRSLWEPAGGLLSSARRAMDVGGHGYHLAKAESVQVSVEPLEDGWCLVTLTADARNVRRQTLGGWFGGLGTGAALSSAGLIVLTGGGALGLLGAGAIATAAMGGAFWGSRHEMDKKRGRLRLALEGVLDWLESGDRSALSSGEWKKFLK